MFSILNKKGVLMKKEDVKSFTLEQVLNSLKSDSIGTHIKNVREALNTHVPEDDTSYRALILESFNLIESFCSKCNNVEDSVDDANIYTHERIL
jgi:hypothetical protein